VSSRPKTSNYDSNTWSSSFACFRRSAASCSRDEPRRSLPGRPFPWWSSSWNAIRACCTCSKIRKLVLCASNNPRPDTIGKVRLKLGEGLTGTRRAGAPSALDLARSLSRSAFSSTSPICPRTPTKPSLGSGDRPQPRRGVINVQHREPHFHTGGEMELLTTVGEQVGCLVALASADSAPPAANVFDLVMARRN